MQTLDWIVIGLFALALIGIIWWVMQQKQANADDYFWVAKTPPGLQSAPLSSPPTSDPNT